MWAIVPAVALAVLLFFTWRAIQTQRRERARAGRHRRWRRGEDGPSVRGGAFGVACLHLVFGAIVRISGSGMGCGDHWPKCYGRWFPPLDRPDLIVEVSHRYLASILLLALIATFVAAWRHRAEPGVGGRGGVLRMAGLGVALGFSAALLGAVTVKLGNAPFATLAHWTVAMSLVATTVATLIRAGGLGGDARGSAACRGRRCAARSPARRWRSSPS